MVVLWKKNDISFILKVDCIKCWRPKTMFFDKVVRNGIKMDRFKEITEKEIYAYYPKRKEISEE